MYYVYGNSSWYIHGGPLFGEVRYWEGPLSEVPLYTSAGVVNHANSLGWLIANVYGCAKSHEKE